jgi:hypothetical protein
MNEITAGALGTLGALIVSVVVVLALFVGVCVLLTLTKLRPSGKGSRVVRGLDELVGERQTYLPPDAPRGPVDQLSTPELLELRARKSA